MLKVRGIPYYSDILRAVSFSRTNRYIRNSYISIYIQCQSFRFVKPYIAPPIYSLNVFALVVSFVRVILPSVAVVIVVDVVCRVLPQGIPRM